MYWKHMVFLILYLSVNIYGLNGRKSFTAAKGHQLLESVVQLRDSLIEITPYINSSLAEIPSNCVQMLCKFICFNGISFDIDLDILMVAQKNNYFCSNIEELRLYNYAFPEDKLFPGFLGNYSDKIKVLYLASSNITDIEAATFANGIFKEIYFENLQLKELKKDFFTGISHDFNTLSIIQKQMPIQTINADFLCKIKYTIKSLTLQAGLKSISNLTGGDHLLSNLVYTDFSHNNFGNRLDNIAFSKVSMLEWLDLSYSNLEYIPAYIFVDFIATLEYLDLSHNKLKTISRYMFGWREMSRDLKIYAEANEWFCTCDLQQEIIYLNLHYKTSLACLEPAKYQGFSVFDENICNSTIGNFSEPSIKPTAVSREENYNISTITDRDAYYHVPEKTTEIQLIEKPDSSSRRYQVPSSNFLKLECSTNLIKQPKTTGHLLRRPLLKFNLKARQSLQIDVVIESSEIVQDTYVLIWFSKVTSKYYEMEINYKEYGLGCYKKISAVNRVKGLTPNTAYTFCLVLKEHMKISPFNCKSIYVENNMAIKNNVWLTQDTKVTGLTLFIFGIIMFFFAGVLITYLLLKHKPLLLQDSQNMVNLNSHKNETKVLPKQKSKRTIGEGNKKLASNGLLAISAQRRNSIESDVSYESYINGNVYEVIPAFETFNTKPANGLITHQTNLVETNNQDTDSCYLTPLESIRTSENFLQYADIPRLSKRNSNDVLPQLPTTTTKTLSSSLTKSQNQPDYARIGNIYFTDSHV